MTKTVTIAVPMYKRLDYLEHVLEVVAAQDYPHLELLISDNGMNGTVVSDAVAAHYPRPFRFRQNPASVNITQHFNQLVAEARGEYLVVLSDDDELSPNYVSELVASLEKHPEATVAIARQEMLRKDGSVVRRSSETMPEVMSGPEFISALWNERSLGLEMVGTFMARTEKLRACGAYPDFCRGTGIDNALLVKLILNDSITLNMRCVFRWRLDEASYGWSVSTRELAQSFREFFDFLETDALILKYAQAHPAEWVRCKSHLVNMTWGTFLDRWVTIYREKLSGLAWAKGALMMPFHPVYSRRMASIVMDTCKAAVKDRFKRLLSDPRPTPSC